MMHSSFWFGSTLNDILIKNLSVSSAGGMVGLCLVMVALTVFYEFLRLILAKVKLYSSVVQSNQDQNTSDNVQLLVNTAVPNKRRLIGFFGEIMIYSVEDCLAYILMLLVMTYNGYVFLSVLVGSMVAYFFTGHKMMQIRLKDRSLKIPSTQLPDTRITQNCESGSNELQPTISSEASTSITTPVTFAQSSSTHM